MVLLSSIRQEMLRTVDELDMNSIDSQALTLAHAKLAKYFALADYTLQLFSTNESIIETMPTPAPAALKTIQAPAYQPSTESNLAAEPVVRETEAPFAQQTSLPIHQVTPLAEVILPNPIPAVPPTTGIDLDPDGLVDGFRLTSLFDSTNEPISEKKPTYKIVDHKKESVTEINRAAAFMAEYTAAVGVAEPPVVEEKEEPVEVKPAPPVVAKPAPKPVKAPPMNTYPLKRMLSGGTLNNDTIFVPEKVIRRHNFRNGDIVRAVFQKTYNGKALYNYEPVEARNEADAKNRHCFEYGVVAYDETLKQFYVEENAQRDLKLKVDGVANKMLVSSNDQNIFHLHEGDIVDVAWYTDRFTEARVIWKYNITEAMKERTEAQRIKERAAKERKLEVEEAEKEEIEQNLAGKSIVLIGCAPYHAEMKQVITERGGRLTALTGEESKIKLNSNIKKSDACIVALQHVSHSASIYSNTWSKKHDVPFESFNGYGKGQFLMATYKALGILGK